MYLALFFSISKNNANGKIHASHFCIRCCFVSESLR
ncbi:MAG: zinc-finger domain-containing protein [Bacteroidales bacterium]